MTGLHLFTSNRLEILAHQFAEYVRQMPLSPLQPEIVVVQSKGMARWLAMQMATECSVWAHVHCPFPTALVDEMMHRVLPEKKIYNITKEEILWRLMAIFPHLENRPEFQPLHHYLADGQPVKQYQLALYLADLFDQYQVYRPEMVAEWDKGKDRFWQALLWRAVFSNDSADEFQHKGTLLFEFVQRLQEENPPEGLPSRITMFGISSLPPYHQHLFEALSQHIPINMFLLNPCQEYWADILSEQEGRRDRKKSSLSAKDLYQHTGNSLLASMGLLGRDFFAALQNRALYEYPNFVEPEQNTVLAQIQTDILSLQEAGGSDFSYAKDESIQVHSCHSPLREVEVLRNHLLSLFESMPDLMPRDILVMMPDIDLYSPYIESTFGISPQDPQWIPFSIADRSLGTEGDPSCVFLALLELLAGRFESGKLLKILESPIVHNKFGLEIEDVERIEQWVEQTSIYWGIDRQHRRDLGGPGFTQNTWRAGLDRLLLGYAMESSGDQLFAGQLPCGPIEGDDVHILESFSTCCELFFSYAEKVSEPRTLSQWASLLAHLLSDCFYEQSESNDLTEIRSILAEMAEMEKNTVYTEPLSPEVIFAHIRRMLEQQSSPFGFLTGGMTFCAMLPMRAIPGKVLCLLGMNDSTFPRPVNTVSFDLMAQAPKPGDRSRRHVDRYLFLEAILSAREQLYISYVGQSQHDDSRMPPSVLVGELLDYMAKMKSSGEKDDVENLVLRHPLQPFNKQYFLPHSSLRSFSEENFQTALAIDEKRHIECLVTEPLPEPESEWRKVDLDQLCRFYCNPARVYGRLRLGLQLPKLCVSPLNHEPRVLDGLNKYGVQQDILHEELAGGEFHSFLPKAQASGRFPPGKVGEAIITDLWIQTEKVVQKVVQQVDHEPVSHDVDITLGKFRITGKVHGVYDGGLVTCRSAKVKAEDQISLWIRHLTLQCQLQNDLKTSSIHVGSDKTCAVGPVSDPDRILQELLSFYWQGLSMPLMFFPRSSYIFASEKMKGSDDAKAVQKAIANWIGSDYLRGESEDPFYRACFKESNPLHQDDFSRLALAVFTPLLSAMEMKAL